MESDSLRNLYLVVLPTIGGGIQKSFLFAFCKREQALIFVA